MASEAARLALYNRLGEVIGEDNAGTLMEALPMHPAEQNATKDDIERVETRFEARFDRLEARIDGLHDVMRDQLRTYTVTTVGAMTVLTAVFGALLAVFR